MAKMWLCYLTQISVPAHGPYNTTLYANWDISTALWPCSRSSHLSHGMFTALTNSTSVLYSGKMNMNAKLNAMLKTSIETKS